MLRRKIDLIFIGILFNASIIGLIFPEIDYLNINFFQNFIGHRSILTHSILVPYLFYYYYVKKKHKPIFHLLNSQVGHHIQKIESDIIVKCMLMAQKQDIPALPVHDALIFPENKKEEGIRIMETAFKTLVGVQGQVKEEI